MAPSKPLIAGNWKMFGRQAAIQFERFTGKPAPVELFREVMKKALADRR